MQVRVSAGRELVLQKVDQIAVVAAEWTIAAACLGRAQGTPVALKAQLGSERVVVPLTDPALAQAAWAGLRPFAHGHEGEPRG
jgi:hypothetical protein